MSKSKGNVLDPLDLCKQYGADAVRFTLAHLASPGRDIKMNDKTVELGRNFLTKLWNVVRFSQMNGCIYNKEFEPDRVSNPFSRWIVSEVKKMILDTESSIENYRFDETVASIYRCVWNSFCDWFLEFAKPVFQLSSIDENSRSGYNLDFTLLKKDLRDTISWAILQFARVLYPITPFISKKLSGELGILEVAWPQVPKADFSEDVRKIERIKEIITKIRTMRQYLHISPGETMFAYVETTEEDIMSLIPRGRDVFKRMTFVELVDKDKITGQTIPVIVSGAVINLEITGKIDAEQEEARLQAEILKFKKQQKEIVARLNNIEFVEKAAPEVVEEHRNRLESLNERIERTEYVLKSLCAV
jgi:valyl-tRNA synthetase